MKTQSLSVALLIPDPDQPRQSIPPGELTELVESIRLRGLLLPIRVRPVNVDGKHVITSGHRRFAALLALGELEAPCIIGGESLDEASILAEQLTENIVRANLSAMEEAKGYRRFLDLRGCSSKEAAQELGIAPSRLSKLLPLVNLPPELQAKVHDGSLAVDTAYNLARLPESEDRTFLFEQALRGRLNRDQAAARTKFLLATKNTPETPKVSLRRVSCLLDKGRTLTLSGREVELESLIESIEVVLKEARKARTQGLDVTTLARVFRDKAGKGGAS
jgi:ParB family transcriptional regulator, chromosome partitioning protein